MSTFKGAVPGSDRVNIFLGHCCNSVAVGSVHITVCFSEQTAGMSGIVHIHGAHICDGITVFHSGLFGTADKPAGNGIGIEPNPAVCVGSAHKAAVSEGGIIYKACKTADPARAPVFEEDEHITGHLQVCDLSAPHESEQACNLPVICIDIQIDPHSTDRVQAAAEGAAEGLWVIIIIPSNGNPKVRTEVNIRRQRDRKALEGVSVVDFLCKGCQIGCVGNDPVARLGGVERRVVISVVRPASACLGELGQENLAADGAVQSLCQRLCLGILHNGMRCEIQEGALLQNLIAAGAVTVLSHAVFDTGGFLDRGTVFHIMAQR